MQHYFMKGKKLTQLMKSKSRERCRNFEKQLCLKTFSPVATTFKEVLASNKVRKEEEKIAY